jgi:hypothetical protein
MPPGWLSRAAALCCVLTTLAAANAFGEGALVKVNDIVLRADGNFQPRALPRHSFAPISFHGYLDIAAKGGGKPVALQEATIDFDRDGRLSAGGLATCPAESIAAASPAEARRACAAAIVGSGRIEALVDLGGGTTAASSPLTIFNGPRQAGHPTVVLHARFEVPAAETLAIVVPIERRRGEFRYRAQLSLPPLAAGLGAITRIEVAIGRRFGPSAARRSYVSARCSDGVLKTHGSFLFADGTIVDGSVEKPCLYLPTPGR